ncbi:tRNA pseudouridine(38-40) synthase TruA [uncultured Draconibacterium sp.]|uniref:tRNA pseudouridine(38-40) synthase TruA n=1 Tax=uncultured Draconibacterium sp. TaxID=1573823 RepID=UPI003216D722
MIRRYFLQLSYKGTNYHGWQIQPNAISVQEVMEDALSKILREKIAVVGAGRTDTGVHASYFILHFDAENKVPENLDLVYKLNSFLPSDIAVQKVWPVNQELHARFSATSRTYHYFISRQKNPFTTKISYTYLKPLDIDKMNEAAQLLFNYEDFTSFSRLHTDVKTNNCKIMQAEWRDEENQLVFVIKADRFLRNMVRAIVGTLLEVGKGKLSINEFCQIIENKDRGLAGASAPAQGLFLVDIGYPEESDQ